MRSFDVASLFFALEIMRKSQRLCVVRKKAPERTLSCPRVIAPGGDMRGYSGGTGIAAKQWLPDWEGAELPRRKAW